jgi:hypothetical protein
MSNRRGYKTGASSLAMDMVRRTFLGRPRNPQQTRDVMRAMSRAARQRRPAGRSQTMRRTASRSAAGVLGGTNADMRSIYRRKRMSRSKRKPWVRFVKKVNAVADKDLGTRTVLFNDQLEQTNSTSTQSTLTLALYSMNNSAVNYLNDLNLIGGLENVANPTATAGGTLTQNTKMMFQSAVMDITLRNTSEKLTSIDPGNPLLNQYQAAPEAAIELDVYEMYVRKTQADNDGRWASISDALNKYDDAQIGGTGTGIAISDRGATPFEFGHIMARCGIKVLKKTKFFIPNGQTITWQCRDPKRRVIRYGECTKDEGFIKPGWTKTYFLVYKLVPGLSQGSQNVGQYRCKINIGVTRKYSYKVEGFNEPRERLIGNSYTVTPNA